MTSKQLAHHDLLTNNGSVRKSERQKASIDRWNQEGTEPSQTALGPSTHTRSAQAAQLGSASGDREDYPGDQNYSYGNSSMLHAEPFQRHQSLLSHQDDPSLGVKAPAGGYDPYDLSPAYLGGYPDESVNHSRRLEGGYPACESRHMHGNSYDSFGLCDRYSSLKEAGFQTDSYLGAEQSRDFSDQNVSRYDPGMSLPGPGYGNLYSNEHDDARFEGPPPDPSPFSFGVQPSYPPGQNRQNSSQAGMGRNSTRGGKPPQAPVANPGSHIYEEEQWGQAAYGWDTTAPSQRPSDSSGMLGEKPNQEHYNGSSQWQTPIEEFQRQRPTQPRGRGGARGSHQRRPYRPDAPNAHLDQPDRVSRGLLLRALWPGLLCLLLA